jgi:hypothetical protein
VVSIPVKIPLSAPSATLLLRSSTPEVLGPGRWSCPIPWERCWLRDSMESWKYERPRSGSNFPVWMTTVDSDGR